MLADFEIANKCHLEPIENIAASLGIKVEDLEPYGRYSAKVPLKYIDEQKMKKARLVLVTSISPTKAGIGKTTVSIGVALGLNKIGKKAIAVLREPSLGPCFGMKGGACGGGYAQVLPMEKINLHFNGDFHAVTSAHNMISAMLDNYFYQRRKEIAPLKKVLWRRVMDVNDRSLRTIETGLGGISNGIPQMSGFDITPASEIMAILCLATSEQNLYERIDNILLGYREDGSEFLCKELGITGSIVALLMDAIKPNLVQTTENTPAIIHGGPFANIAHGCNSILATRLGLSLGDYVITEAGFGADLGAEKFLDIKCRNMGILPDLVVLVATCNGLKMHGDVDEAHIKEPNLEGLRRGFANLDQHVRNLRQWKRNIIVAFNRFANDTDEEVACLVNHCRNELGLPCVVNDGFMRGGEGARELAQAVVDEIDAHANQPEGGDAIYSTTVHADGPEQTIKQRIEAVVKKVYHAASVTFTEEALSMLEGIQRDPYYWDFPVCIAKTQFSFSDDPKKYGCPSGFNFTISDIVINRGAHFIVAIAGKMMRMPGLPKVPAALHIRVEDGKIVGLS